MKPIEDQAVLVGCLLVASANENQGVIDAIFRSVPDAAITCGMAKKVWAAAKRLTLAGVLPGIIELAAEGVDRSYLVQSVDSVPSLLNWAYYCRRVMDAHRATVLASRAHELARLAKTDVKEAMGLAVAMADGLGDAAQVTYSPDDSLAELEFSRFETIPSGLCVQDAPVAGGGWVKGEMSLVCAATGRGKTLMLCQSALAAIRAGKRVAFATFELPHARITQRILQMMCGYRSKVQAEKQNGADGVRQWDAACEEFLEFGRLLTYFDSGMDMSRKRFVEPFVSWFMMAHDRDPFDGFYFDYLQRVRPEKDLGSRHENVNEVSLQISGLANVTKTAGVVAAQIKAANGELELRHSRDPEDHAATILYRGTVAVGKGKDAQQAEALWHDKNRHARRLEHLVTFDETYLTLKFAGEAGA